MIAGDQFRQADRLQETGRHPGGKGVPQAGDERQTRPQGITGGGMGVVVEGIEEQIAIYVRVRL